MQWLLLCVVVGKNLLAYPLWPQQYLQYPGIPVQYQYTAGRSALVNRNLCTKCSLIMSEAAGAIDRLWLVANMRSSGKRGAKRALPDTDGTEVAKPIAKRPAWHASAADVLNSESKLEAKVEAKQVQPQSLMFAANEIVPSGVFPGELFASKLSLLTTFDFAPLLPHSRSALIQHGLSAELAPRLLLDFARFLLLKVLFEDWNADKISPTPLMDLVWHAAILNTRFYEQLLLRLNVRIHHTAVAGLESPEEFASGGGDSFEQCRALRRQLAVDSYRAIYGTEPLSVDSAALAPPTAKSSSSTCHDASSPRANPPSSNVSKPSEHINICVHDQSGFEMYVRVLPTTPLEKVKLAYCHLVRASPTATKIMFNGCPIGPQETPADLGMVDTADIDAMIHRVGC